MRTGAFSPPPPSSSPSPPLQSSSPSSPPPRFVVLTRVPPRSLRWLHDRCPCILPTEEMAREWLFLFPSNQRGGRGGAMTTAAAATEVLSRAGDAVERACPFSSSSPSSSPVAGEPKDAREIENLPPLLSWHPVTPEMGKTSYQRDDASRDTRKGGIASLFGKAAAAAAAATASASAAGGIKKEAPSVVAVKEEAKKTPKPPPKNIIPPSPLHSGIKRENGKTEKLASPQQASRKKTKAQRSLDAFLSSKKNKQER